GTTEVFRWENGVTVGLGSPTGASSSVSPIAKDVSADGAKMVGIAPSSPSGPEVGWIWDGGAFSLPFSAARAVSPDGRADAGGAGGLSSVWSEADGTRSLGDIANGIGENGPNDVSADGRVVVGYVKEPSGQAVPRRTGFVWDEASGMRRVEDVLASAGLDI